MKTLEWKTGLLWFVPGIILGMALLSLFQMYGGQVWGKSTVLKGSTDTAVAANTNTAGNSAAASANIVTVSNQPAGRAVMVDKAVLSSLGWVAVRDWKNNAWGNILGAVRREAGTHEKVVVDLLRATVPDSSYVVVLYRDDGDKKFDSKKDTVLTDAAGKPLTFSFKAETPRSPNGR